MKTQTDTGRQKQVYRWEEESIDVVIEHSISPEGDTTYHCTDCEDVDDCQRRVGTTGLFPAAADQVWIWYNEVYETTLVNENRARGIQAFFERAVLFPWRTATTAGHRHESAEFTLPLEWAQWVVQYGITYGDVDRTDLLIAQQGAADLPVPGSQSEQSG